MSDFKFMSENAVTSPPAVMLELNVAAPAADMSRVNAVIVEPLSLPLKSISLS